MTKQNVKEEEDEAFVILRNFWRKSLLHYAEVCEQLGISEKRLAQEMQCGHKLSQLIKMELFNGLMNERIFIAILLILLERDLDEKFHKVENPKHWLYLFLEQNAQWIIQSLTYQEIQNTLEAYHTVYCHLDIHVITRKLKARTQKVIKFLGKLKRGR